MNSYFIYETSSYKYLKSNDTYMCESYYSVCRYYLVYTWMAGSLWLLHSSRRAWNPQSCWSRVAFSLGTKMKSINIKFFLDNLVHLCPVFLPKPVVRACCHYFIFLIKMFWISATYTIQYSELQKGMQGKEPSPGTTVNKINVEFV